MRVHQERARRRAVGSADSGPEYWHCVRAWAKGRHRRKGNKAMRDVRLVYLNDNGQDQEVCSEVNDVAISDLIKVLEIMDGDEEYEPGMILDYRELRP